MIQRLCRHLFSPSVRRAFPPATLQAITEAIAAGEQRHGGQVMFAVEADLPLHALWCKVTPRQAAEHAFARLRTWDTTHNNGVLIYLLLAEHAIEIVADRGIHSRVDAAAWTAMMLRMSAAFREGRFEDGLTQALEEISALLVEHFPLGEGELDVNELPDEPVVL